MLFRGLEIERIEELLKRILNKSFSEAKSVIEQRIDELLEIYGKTLPEETRQILVVGYYRAAQEYKIAKPRRLGGPYFLHPEQTVAVLLDAGVTDPVTLLAGLFHDAVEERLSAFYKELSKKNVRFNLRKSREERYIAEESAKIQHRLAVDLAHQGIFNANAIAAQVFEPVLLLTRRKKELYYHSINRLFFPPLLNYAESSKRAILVKFADRYANTLDLERADYTTYPAKIYLYDVVDAFGRNDMASIHFLEQTTEALAQDHPLKTDGKFSGDQKLHPCFKNIILLNQYREWVLAGNASVPEVASMCLAGLTERATQKIIDHLCTYHAGNSSLNLRRVYELYKEHEAYIASGGYECVTRQGSKKAEGYDGIVQKFFHARIRGNSDALAELYKNRALMLRAAIGFNYLCHLYGNNSQFYLKGLTSEGVHAEAPAIHHKK